MLGHDLTRLNVQAASGSLQHKQAMELIGRIGTATRALCTNEALGVLSALGVNPFAVSLLTSSRRGSDARVV